VSAAAAAAASYCSISQLAHHHNCLFFNDDYYDDCSLRVMIMTRDKSGASSSLSPWSPWSPLISKMVEWVHRSMGIKGVTEWINWWVVNHNLDIPLYICELVFTPKCLHTQMFPIISCILCANQEMLYLQQGSEFCWTDS
jgi:hypothetical protein